MQFNIQHVRNYRLKLRIIPAKVFDTIFVSNSIRWTELVNEPRFNSHRRLPLTISIVDASSLYFLVQRTHLRCQRDDCAPVHCYPFRVRRPSNDEFNRTIDVWSMRYYRRDIERKLNRIDSLLFKVWLDMVEAIKRGRWDIEIHKNNSTFPALLIF